MLKNYFVVAFRNLKRNMVFSTINIVGLSLGLTCSLLIMLWVFDERGVDQFHEHKDRLYTVYERQFSDGRVGGGNATPGLLARELKKEFPEIEYATALGWNSSVTFQLGDKLLRLPGCAADSDYFKMYSFPLLEGSAQSALSSPVSLAISRKTAVAFFGSPEAAIGKTLRADDRKDFKITAVYENMPDNSTHQYDFLLNWHDVVENNPWVTQFDNNGPGTVIMLRKDADPAKLEAKMEHLLDRYIDTARGWRVELALQKTTERYLWSNMKEGKIVGGRIEYVRLFSMVALFIMIIACINFMNLTTARSIKRSREIGVRKVVGALRSGLIRQFIGEAILVAGIAMLISIVLLFVSLPLFNQLTQKKIGLPFDRSVFWIGMILLTFVTGLLSGIYPALFLSSFKPVVVLKGVLRISPSANWFRKGLVVFQFALSSLLIIGTIIVSQQVSFIQSKNLGYNRENVIRVSLLGDPSRYYELFKQRVKQLRGVTNITRADQDPMNIGSSTIGIEWDGKNPNSKPLFSQVGIGYDFINTMQMKLVAGRDFSKDYGTDTANYILNEAAIKRIGYTDPIGRSFTMWDRKGVIVGVVKDFHYNSMYNPINPVILYLQENTNWGYALVRAEGNQTKAVLESIEQISKEINPKFPFVYDFADDNFKRTFTRETLVKKLSNCFAVLAIVISCLGLLGLAMFAAEQRVREIGIRKVLGAGLFNLFGILSKEFLLLVFIAFLVACPLAWWAMNNWLHNFEFRVSIDIWPFVMAGLAAIAIAVFTISFQTIRAALANPVKSLRSE